jgi:hypothetical protein
MKFSPRHHVLERGHDRRCRSTIELGKSINQQLQAQRQFKNLSPKRLAKPLPDLIADRPAMDVIDPYIYGVLFRHDETQRDPT